VLEVTQKTDGKNQFKEKSAKRNKKDKHKTEILSTSIHT